MSQYIRETSTYQSLVRNFGKETRCWGVRTIRWSFFYERGNTIRWSFIAFHLHFFNFCSAPLVRRHCLESLGIQYLKISAKNCPRINSMLNLSSFLILCVQADGNRNTVCYNHVCKGFVQVDNTIMLGAELYPVSKYNGDQYEVRLTLNLVRKMWKKNIKISTYYLDIMFPYSLFIHFQDHEIQSWWLQYGEKLVGYWPLSLFPNFRASLVQWSGQVFKSSAGHPTITQMGSGHFPNEGLYKAAYFANAKVRVREEDYYEIGDAKTHAPKPWCYDIGRIEDGNRFLYGGPGVGPNCAWNEI